MPNRWQYQALAEPLFTGAAAEVVTLDKWFCQRPEITRGPKRCADFPSTFEPLEPTQLGSLDWLVEHPGPPPARRLGHLRSDPGLFQLLGYWAYGEARSFAGQLFVAGGRIGQAFQAGGRAGAVFRPEARAGGYFMPGSIAGEVYVPGGKAGEEP